MKSPIKIVHGQQIPCTMGCYSIDGTRNSEGQASSSPLYFTQPLCGPGLAGIGRTVSEPIGLIQPVQGAEGVALGGKIFDEPRNHISGIGDRFMQEHDARPLRVRAFDGRNGSDCLRFIIIPVALAFGLRALPLVAVGAAPVIAAVAKGFQPLL